MQGRIVADVLQICREISRGVGKSPLIRNCPIKRWARLPYVGGGNMGEEQMGLFEFSELVQQQDPQDQPRRKNPFGGLIDGAKGLVHKGKEGFEKLDEEHHIRDKAAQTGRVVGDVAKGVGQNYAQQGKDLAGSAKREISGQATPEDHKKLIGTAAGLYLGGAPALILNGGGRGGGIQNIPTDAQSYKDIYGSAQRAITGQGTEADKSRLLEAGRSAAGFVAPNNPLVKADAMFGRGMPQLNARGDQGSVYGQVIERGAQALSEIGNSRGGDRGAGNSGYTAGGLANFNPESYRDRMRHINPGTLLGNSFPRLSNQTGEQIIEKVSNIAGDKLAQVQHGDGGTATLLSGTAFDMSKIGGKFAQNSTGDRIIKGLGGLIKGGIEDATRVDTLGFVAKVSENFDKLDVDKDGHISKADINSVKEDDPIFSVANLHLMNFMEKNMDKLSNMSNDDWFSESKGITRGDITALKEAKEGTGYGVVGSALSGAWDGKYAAIAAGLGAGLWGSASTAARAGRAGVAAVGVMAVTGLYDGYDYYSNRKGNIEAMLGELK
jgi:hypothetical protein